MTKRIKNRIPKLITIATGTELMLGETLDLNFTYMGKKLAQSGYFIYRHYVVGDDDCELKNIFSEALSKASVVIMTGGLGPTTDDLTREIVSSVIKKPLTVNKVVLKNLKERFRKLRTKLPFCNYKQAMIIKNAKVIPNRIGTAPGMYIKQHGKQIFLLPGPPFEMNPMFEGYVIKKIMSLWPVQKKKILTFRTFGIRESEVQEKMDCLLIKKKPLLNSLGYCSSPAGVDVRIIAEQKEYKAMFNDIKKMKKELKPWIYSNQNMDLSEALVRLLKKNKKTISIAESCTGGLILQRITCIPGASKVLNGGVVAYSNQSKIEILKVERDIIEKHGAVSQSTALAMAKNVRLQGKSDIGLSITGIAGPGGGSKKKPVGLVWIGVSDKEKDEATEYYFTGPRRIIQFRASQTALDLVRKRLTNKEL